MAQSIKNLIASLMISISGFLFWTQVLPVYQFTSQLKSVISERRELFISRTEIMKKIEDLNSERGARYSEIQRLALFIPETKSLPEIISMIESMMSQSGNALGEFSFGDTSTPEVLKVIALDIGSIGTYDSLLNLLGIIERNIRLFDVTFISISENPESIGGNLLNFQLKGHIYWLKQADAQSIVPESSSADGAN